MRGLYSAFKIVSHHNTFRPITSMLPKRTFITSQVQFNLLQQQKIALSCSLLHNLAIFETLTLSSQEDRDCSKTGKIQLENEDDTM